MPLFMDYHVIAHVTIDDIKRAHIADVTIQDHYNVKYHQFWVNETAGTVFCLMEGPDMESCARVHREAHGEVACQIVEVERGFYNLMMGETHLTDHGLVQHKDGLVDTGYRYIMVVDILGTARPNSPVKFGMPFIHDQIKKMVSQFIARHRGREMARSDYYGMVAVFTEASDAVACATNIQSELLIRMQTTNDDAWDSTFKIGISAGQPVTIGDDFFEKTIKLAFRLSLIAREKEILISALAAKMSGRNLRDTTYTSLRTMRASDENFLGELFGITENHLADDTYTVEKLSREIGISRPQLYRKILSVTGLSPNSFIRDIKMTKALSLLRDKEFNISEISLKVGYNNPSYFSRCFHKKYGIVPSRISHRS